MEQLRFQDTQCVNKFWLQVIHAQEKPICESEIGDLELIIKKVQFSAVSDAAGPEKQWIYLPRPNVVSTEGLV